MAQEILFIGLGNMGLPMALRLVGAGHRVCGFDVEDKARDAFEKAGGHWQEELQPQQAEVVFAMLPGGAQMRQLHLHEQKLFSLLPRDTLVVDCSTAEPQTARTLYEEAKARGIRFLSAPVSGGVVGAANGTLTFMVGGEAQDLQAIEPLLRIMGKNIFHAGAAGDGQSVKICNNMLLAIHMIGTCEAFALGEALGLDAQVLSRIMQASSGNNWSLEKYNPWPGLMPNSPASNNHKGGFSVRLMLKDLTLAMSAMEQTRREMELGRKAFDIYKKHLQEGHADKDFSHILTAIQGGAGGGDAGDDGTEKD